MLASESVVFTLNLFGFTCDITNLLIVAIVYSLFMIILGLAYRHNKIIQNVFRKIFDLIKNVAISNAGSEKYAFLLFFLFIAILITNLLRCFGFVAVNSFYFFPVIYSAFIVFFGLFYGFKVRKLKFFWNLVPHSVPAFLKLPLMIIETVTLITKPIILCARLFLNITIGHIVVHSLTQVALSFGSFGLLATPLFVIINLMEIGIGIIQAYVFVVFSALFISSCTENH